MLSVKIRKEMAAGGFTLDVEFEAQAGVTVLFGASGSGKTLTLKAIAGLERPDAGVINVDGRALFDSARGVDLPARARRVGYVFQNLALFPHLTARENVEFPVTHLPARERRERALTLLTQFGVRHTAERLPRAVSGGEAQRVALARALAGEPRLLLLDEPLSALDEPIKLGIIDDLRRLNRSLRLPVIYVTHSRDEAVSLGERALIYERGRVVAAGEPLEVFGAPVTAGVARLTGVENIFEGTVAARDEEAGTMRVRVGAGGGGDAGDGGGGGDAGCTVEAPLGRQPVGARVRVAVRSGDIMLATDEPRGLSARNLLRGRVTRVEPRAEQTLVHVSAGVTWAAGVTRQSLHELGLETGRPAWLAFKTYAVRVFDEE